MQLGGSDKSISTQAEVPLLQPGYTSRAIGSKISSIVITPHTPLGWLVGFGIGAILFTVYLIATTYLFAYGVGIWGINIPVAWAFDIVTFVWWIGIGHAGTLISAILFLLRQNWRTSINRFA